MSVYSDWINKDATEWYRRDYQQNEVDHHRRVVTWLRSEAINSSLLNEKQKCRVLKRIKSMARYVEGQPQLKYLIEREKEKEEEKVNNEDNI